MSFYDQDGKKTDFKGWESARKGADQIVFNETVIAPNKAEYRVVTRFEGLSGEPWECAVTLLSGKDELNVVGCHRFLTQADAEVGHDGVVLRIIDGNKIVVLELSDLYEKCLSQGVPLNKITDPVTGRIDEVKLVAEDAKLAPVEDAEEVKIG